MKIFRRMCCLTAALLTLISAGRAEEAVQAVDTGLDLSENLSVHYPMVTGGGDEALTARINQLIQEKCRIGDYLARMAWLLSDGSLRTEWRGGVLGDVFSCAVSAQGALEDSRNTHAWTAVTVDLRDGHEITLSELFTDENAARERMEAYLEEVVAPELSAHLQYGEVIPLPDVFQLERSGLTLLYPVRQLSTLSDRAGDIRIGWNALRETLDLSEDSVLRRIGAAEMMTLSAESAARLRETAAEGSLTDIPVTIGDSMQTLTDRYHLLTDPDGFEDGRLFFLEGGCFRGVSLMTDDLSRDWEKSVVQGIRMEQGCLWGLCVGETQRAGWLEALGEPEGSAAIGEEKAEANRLAPGNCDYYRCGEYQLQLYSDEEGTLVSVILTE